MQKLVLPINKCLINASYGNALYNKLHGYPHYGMDLTSTVNDTTVYALGNGIVFNCGMDGKVPYDRLGNCIVVIYKGVALPNGKTVDLACRMFHFDTILVKKGQSVTKNTVIGKYGNTGGTTINSQPMGAHLHIEFDTDIKSPEYAYGIKQSGNIIKKGTINSTVNPSDIWYVDTNQSIVGFGGGWNTDKDVNIPKISSSNSNSSASPTSPTPSVPSTSQKLILPINNTRVTASWKTNSYSTRFGMIHYGVDMVSSAGSTVLYASGNGTVLNCGYDNILGNMVVIKYPNSYNRITGKTQDVICRMWHMASITVKKGQSVTKDTKLGLYGNTGQYSTGAHLHIEFDTDVVNPYYTPTLSGTSTFFKGTKQGANDKTMSNPLEWLYCKTSAPDKQTYTTANDIYIRPEDKTIAVIA